MSGSAGTHRPGSGGIEPHHGAGVTTTDIDADAEGGQPAGATTEAKQTRAGATQAETDPTKAGALVTVASDREDTCGKDLDSEDLDGDSLDDDVDWADFDDRGKRVLPVLRVSTSLDALRSGLHRAGVTDSGENLSAATLRRLACDAEIIPTVLNGKGRVIDVGRRSRRVGEALRCVLIARDGGCVWPGCDAPPSRCDAHHVKHWADGGPTNADNLALLCHRHHILLHEGGHHLQCHGDSWVVLKPDGTRLHKPPAAALGDSGSSGLSVRDSIGFSSAGVDSPVDRRTDADSEFDAPRRSTNGSTAASPRQLTLACDSRRELSIRLKSPAPARNIATTSATPVNRSRDGTRAPGLPLSYTTPRSEPAPAGSSVSPCRGSPQTTRVAAVPSHADPFLLGWEMHCAMDAWSRPSPATRIRSLRPSRVHIDQHLMERP